MPDVVYKTVADSIIMSTAKTQKVRGSSDARVTIYCDEADHASVTKLYLKLKPNSDGVFVIPAGALIWAKPELARGSGENFGQLKDTT